MSSEFINKLYLFYFIFSIPLLWTISPFLANEWSTPGKNIPKDTNKESHNPSRQDMTDGKAM